MIVGVGSFEVDPSERDEFVQSYVETMQISRGEEGCLEYTFAPDPLEPGRVVLVEKWESQETLDAHLAALRERAAAAPESRPVATSASLVLYDTAGEKIRTVQFRAGGIVSPASLSFAEGGRLLVSPGCFEFQPQ